MFDLMQEQTLTVAAACAMFDISRGTLENWFKDGLEKVKVGGRAYTSREAFQRHVIRLAEKAFDDELAAVRPPRRDKLAKHMDEIRKFEAIASRRMFEARHPRKQ